VTVLAQRRTVDGRAHGELLAPAIQAVLAEAGAKPADLAAIVAGLGPGPFTGLRVGLVTAAAMAQALAIPAYGVCSLDGIGASLPGVALVATDARRKEVYWAVYDQGVRIIGPAVDRPADVPVLARRSGFALVAGEGARLYPDAFGVPVADEPCYPSPRVLAALAADRIRSGVDGELLRPLYLRRPDAVEPVARVALP